MKKINGRKQKEYVLFLLFHCTINMFSGYKNKTANIFMFKKIEEEVEC